MLLMLSLLRVLQVGATDTLVISLDQATQRVLRVSPQVSTAVGAVQEPRGQRAQAWWPFPENPTLEYGRIRRESGTARTNDTDWAVTQEIELFGQWAFRGSGASALVRSAEARVDDSRRAVALQGRRAYAALVIAERRAALTDSAASFAERLADFARRQFEAGEANRLELNAAVLEAARARSSAQRAHAGLATAAADLGRLLALPPDSTVRSVELPPIPPLNWSSDSLLLTLARARRPDLLAAQTFTQASNKNATAARLSVLPNLTVAAVGGHESGTDDLRGWMFGLRVPLFHRGQRAIGAAMSAQATARADSAATERLIQSEVVTAGAQFRQARLAERRFATEILRAATENVTLTERALSEGEVSLTDVIVLRATAVNAQLEYLEVLREAADAWFELAAALAVEPSELVGLLGGDQ